MARHAVLWVDALPTVIDSHPWLRGLPLGIVAVYQVGALFTVSMIVARVARPTLLASVSCSVRR